MIEEAIKPANLPIIFSNLYGISGKVKISVSSKRYTSISFVHSMKSVGNAIATPKSLNH